MQSNDENNLVFEIPKSDSADDDGQFMCSLDPISITDLQKNTSEEKDTQLHIPKQKHNKTLKKTQKPNQSFDVNRQVLSPSLTKYNGQLLKVLETGREKSFVKSKNRFNQSESFSFFPDQTYSIDELKRENPNGTPHTKDGEQVRESFRNSKSQFQLDSQIPSPTHRSPQQSIQKRKRKGSSIYSKATEFLGGTKITQKQIRDRRKNQLLVAKQILTGKVSIIWIFLLTNLEPEQQERIKAIYHGLSDKKYVVPLCKEGWEIKPFLEVPNNLFKIVFGVEHLKNINVFKDDKRIVQIYIHCENKDRQISQALSYKSQSRKIKGIFFDLDKILDKAQEQLENQIKLFQSKKGLAKRKYVSRFPNFMRLSGEDKSFASLYRGNLYGAKNLLIEEKKQMLEQFLSFAEEKFGDDQLQAQNLKQYKQIDHQKEIKSLEQAKQVIMFYVRESFYYKILNSMLRTAKTTEQFRPCILPFNQTYHAIKAFYNQQLTISNRKISAATLYRGTKLRERDYNNLKQNSFIQIFGFMSTSKSIQRAKEFTDHLGNIFVIHIPEMTIPSKYDQYDHGFVDINQYKLAESKFLNEEEILFNSLNIYKVKQIVKDQKQGYNYIHLEYGVIFDLLSKRKKDLTDDEKDILLNYQYCTHVFEKIQDLGDVYFLSEEYEKAIYYYEKKIQNSTENTGKYYYKLGKVQQSCGRLEEAQKNTRKSLQFQLAQSTQSYSDDKALECVEIYSQNSSICLDIQDFLQADQSINDAIDLIPDDNFLTKAKKIRQRGSIRAKKGQITRAQDDFFLSQSILRDIDKSISEKKNKIKTNYLLNFATLWCSTTTLEELDRQKQKEIQEVDDLEEQIKNMEEEITEQLIRINQELKQTAISTGNKDQYQECIKKAKHYLLSLKTRKTKDPIEQAKLKVLEATIQDYLQLKQSSQLLEEAIELVAQSDPFNEKVGKCSELLANIQKQHLQKFTSPKQMMKLQIQIGMQPIVYDESKQKQIAKKCKQNYQKAIQVLLYHNKSSSSPQVVQIKNQIGELQLNQTNYKSGYQILTEALQSRKGIEHSQLSRSCLLLSRISYARGQLKHSFGHIEEAQRILRKSLVKSENEKYIKIYQSSQAYFEIKVFRAKIYLRQLKYDLSLRDLSLVEEKIKQKINEKQHHYLLSDIHEIRAENKATNRDDGFVEQFEKAIKLRKKQYGEYNLPNAITYCNYGKFLTLNKQLSQANECLSKASQIFSCFSEDHPVTWLVYYCFGIYNEKLNKSEEYLEMLKRCLEVAHKKFDRSHISINKIRFQYGRSLYKNGKIQESIDELQELEDDLEAGLKDSFKRSFIQSEEDDEKINLQKNLYIVLEEVYRKTTANESGENLNQSQLGISRCLHKLNSLRSYSKKQQQT